ncbi:MAG: hypothetical protein HYV42_04005 [Candidatus Magasanikbacteria bacterium]|nr:hypothetical protein [Candidatus Magasanikbacteria bacterium]
MVTVTRLGEREQYACEICGYQYTDRNWAEQCEAWCRANSSCNLEIIAHGAPPAARTDAGDQSVGSV